MELYYPVKNPIFWGNPFGAPEHFADITNQKGHPGLDFECPTGTPLFAPCDGDAFYTTDKFGGDGIWIRVPNNGNPQYNVILWHLIQAGNPQYPFKIDTAQGAVTPVKAGQLLGYTGDSGYPNESTGPHLHLGVMPCDFTGAALDPANGYLGCVDPTQFFNGRYAEDISVVNDMITTTEQIVPEIAASTIQNEDKLSLLNLLTTFILKVAQYLNLHV